MACEISLANIVSVTEMSPHGITAPVFELLHMDTSTVISSNRITTTIISTWY